MGTLAALYFPYASAPLKALKEAALYFDQIYCIDPEAIEGKTQLPQQADAAVSGQPSIEQWREYRALWDAGVCKALRPEQIRSNWDNLLTESVLKDLQDKRYVGLCARSGLGSWSLAETKMGEGLVHHLMDLADNVRSELPGDVHSWIVDRTSFGGTRFREVNQVQFREGEYLGQGIRYVDMPFVLAESVLVNLAMCACASLSENISISPLTDERIHYSVLKAKYARAMGDQDMRDLLALEGVIRQAKEGALVKEIFRSASLPSVGDLPAQKILDLRKKYKDKLADFRVEMSDLVQQVEQEPWSPEFEESIRKTVDTRVRPRMRQLKWDISAERDQYWLETAPAAVGREASSSWIASALAGAPVAGVLLGAGKSAVSLVSSWLGHKKQERAVKRNGLTYLLEVGRSRGTAGA
jgi:hypothetical protein